MSEPTGSPRRRAWRVYLAAVLGVVLLGAGLWLVLKGGDGRSRSADELLRSVCERDPAVAEVRAVVGAVVGRYLDGKGCVWREGATSTQLVAREASMSLDRWTQLMGRTDRTVHSSKNVQVRVVRSATHCTAAFDDTAGGTVEVEAPTELDVDCQKTAAAAASIADAVRP